MADARGLLGDSWAFTKAVGNGAYDAGAGMVEGLGDLAKGGYELATDASARESAWETSKQLAEAAGNYGESVIDDPGKAYQDARDGALAAYDKFEAAKDLAAAEGRSAEFFGDMAGGALFEVGTILVPVGLLAKAGKLGKVASVADDVADVAKVAKKVENAEDVLGATQKAKAVSVNPAIKELDDKVSPVQKCPVDDCDVGIKNTKPKGTPEFTNLKQMDKSFVGEETGAIWGTKVEYLDDIERQQYQLHIKDGKLYDAKGNLFDTANAQSAFGGKGNAIFVMDEHGSIYASTVHSPGKFHHSSFLSGQQVASAGEIVTKKGVIKEVTRRSGHYQPTSEQLEQFTHKLKENGVNMKKVNIGVGF